MMEVVVLVLLIGSAAAYLWVQLRPDPIQRTPPVERTPSTRLTSPARRRARAFSDDDTGADRFARAFADSLISEERRSQHHDRLAMEREQAEHQLEIDRIKTERLKELHDQQFYEEQLRLPAPDRESHAKDAVKTERQLKKRARIKRKRRAHDSDKRNIVREIVQNVHHLPERYVEPIAPPPPAPAIAPEPRPALYILPAQFAEKTNHAEPYQPAPPPEPAPPAPAVILPPIVLSAAEYINAEEIKKLAFNTAAAIRGTEAAHRTAMWAAIEARLTEQYDQLTVKEILDEARGMAGNG